MLGDAGHMVNYLVAGVFFIFGLVLLDVLPLPWVGRGPAGSKRKGPLAAWVMGLIFGIALGPCSFAYMAPVLGVTAKLAAAQRTLFAAAVLLAYGVGYCAVITLAGTFTEVVQRVLNWNENSKGAKVLKTICGVLVLLGGLFVLYAA
jgi:cytochrome c-type biogenesis protein